MTLFPQAADHLVVAAFREMSLINEFFDPVLIDGSKSLNVVFIFIGDVNGFDSLQLTPLV